MHSIVVQKERMLFKLVIDGKGDVGGHRTSLMSSSEDLALVTTWSVAPRFCHHSNVAYNGVIVDRNTILRWIESFRRIALVMKRKSIGRSSIKS